MDLYAYAQIRELEEIAKKNGIEVPILRGYRLMKDEKSENFEAIDKKDIEVGCVKFLCESDPFWQPNSDCATFDSWTDYLKSYYLVETEDEDGWKHYSDVRWDRIHGWKRKVLKTYIHNELQRQRKQHEVWNKYVGREDVLYIHAGIGGDNWPYYYKEVVDQPWFLEKVDDSFDSTYCDIYAKIRAVPDNA